MWEPFISCGPKNGVERPTDSIGQTIGKAIVSMFFASGLARIGVSPSAREPGVR